MRLRQIVLAAESIEPTRSLLFELLGLEDAFVDPAVAEFGLTNVVMAIGDSFLEIVSPVEAKTSVGRLLAREGRPSGYMLIFQVPDLACAKQRLEEQGARQVWSYADDRVRACHVHPKDIGGAIVSFDEMHPPEQWYWAGSGWRERRATHARRVLGSTLGAAQPDALAARWSAVLGRAVRTVEGRPTLELDDDTFVEFVPGEGEPRVVGFTFEVDDRAEMGARARSLGLDSERPQIGGVTLDFVSPSEGRRGS